MCGTAWLVRWSTNSLAPGGTKWSGTGAARQGDDLSHERIADAQLIGTTELGQDVEMNGANFSWALLWSGRSVPERVNNGRIGVSGRVIPGNGIPFTLPMAWEAVIYLRPDESHHKIIRENPGEGRRDPVWIDMLELRRYNFDTIAYKFLLYFRKNQISETPCRPVIYVTARHRSAASHPCYPDRSPGTRPSSESPCLCYRDGSEHRQCCC